MSAITVTEASLRVVLLIEEETKPAAEAITRGQIMRMDTAGKWVKAAADTAPHAGNKRAVCLKTVAAGETCSGLRKGIVDIGNGLSALAYDAQVFLSDTAGGIDTAAGTVSTVIGTVESAWAGGPTTADKLLRVDF